MNRDLKAVLIGSVVALSGWVTLRGVPAGLARLERYEASVAQSSDLLARAHLRVKGLDALDDSITTFDAVAAALPRMILMGSEAETASADLMRRTRNLLSADRTRVLGFERRPGGPRAGPLALAAISVQLETDFVELLVILEQIDADSALTAESIQVTAADPHADAATPEHLTAVLEVSGWYRPVPRQDAQPPGDVTP